MNIAAIGIGAGLVSALLFAVVITGSPLAMLLSFVAPLPIFIASLGWNHRSGLVAALAGGLALGLGISPTAGLAFAVGWALPAWWLGYLALLGRPVGPGIMEWYPTGRLLLWISGSAALITVLGVLTLGDGSYEAYQTNLREAFSSYLESQGPQAQDDAPGASEVLSLLVGAMPLLFAFNFVMVLALNLWLAAKTVQVSGRLPRPWPEIPSTFMPWTALVLLGAAIVVSFVPGIAGAAGLALVGALVAAFALQGLAFIHDTSRERPGRAFLLSTVYVLAFLVSSISLPLLALLGLADVAVGLRHRLGSGKAGPGSRST
jgi:hypothetical protein